MAGRLPPPRLNLCLGNERCRLTRVLCNTMYSYLDLRAPSITQETGNLLTTHHQDTRRWWEACVFRASPKRLIAHILYLHSVIPGTYSNVCLHMSKDGLPYTKLHLFSVSLPSVTRSRKRSMWICYAAGLRRVALFCKPCCFCLFPPSSVGLPTASFWSYVVSSIGLSSAPYESYVLLT